MSYFEEQQEQWWSGGLFAYAEDKGIRVKVDDLPDNPTMKQMEKVERRIYRKLGLPYGAIPADFDPYNHVYED